MKSGKAHEQLHRGKRAGHAFKARRAETIPAAARTGGAQGSDGSNLSGGPNRGHDPTHTAQTTLDRQKYGEHTHLSRAPELYRSGSTARQSLTNGHKPSATDDLPEMRAFSWRPDLPAHPGLLSHNTRPNILRLRHETHVGRASRRCEPSKHAPQPRSFLARGASPSSPSRRAQRPVCGSPGPSEGPAVMMCSQGVCSSYCVQARGGRRGIDTSTRGGAREKARKHARAS